MKSETKLCMLFLHACKVCMFFIYRFLLVQSQYQISYGIAWQGYSSSCFFCTAHWRQVSLKGRSFYYRERFEVFILVQRIDWYIQATVVPEKDIQQYILRHFRNTLEIGTTVN